VHGPGANEQRRDGQLPCAEIDKVRLAMREGNLAVSGRGIPQLRAKA